jgi:hypothetical protein
MPEYFCCFLITGAISEYDRYLFALIVGTVIMPENEYKMNESVFLRRI